MVKTWYPGTTKLVHITQNVRPNRPSLQLTLTQFEFPTDVLEMEREIFASTWGIADLTEAARGVLSYIDSASTFYGLSYLQHASETTREVFVTASLMARSANASQFTLKF